MADARERLGRMQRERTGVDLRLVPQLEPAESTASATRTGGLGGSLEGSSEATLLTSSASLNGVCRVGSTARPSCSAMLCTLAVTRELRRAEQQHVAAIDRCSPSTCAACVVPGACVPPLRAAPRAAVVNTANIAGLRPGPQPFPYSASKAAVVNLTRTLAGALGPAIRVNAVAPGWMEGDWMQARLGENYDRLMERRARMTPLGRCVTAEDVAATIVSPAMLFVTGEVVIVDGGYSATT